MNILEIIAKKRDNKKLEKEEIEFFINGYTKGEVADYQAAALIMAIYIYGLDKEETTNLALAMANSGDILDLSCIPGNIVDKHSTGGVGDKVTIALMPVIASLGIPVAKMSGRGLGFTGGTVDKLESIPGYKVEVPIDEFIDNVQKTGISIIGQTINLAPADKKIYALRDTISCVSSMPLIASSIMSKKIAAGANKIVLDVTVGSGAFMKTKEDAIQLATAMNDIGKLSGKETVSILTSMEEPLGKMVGNTLEMLEVIEILNDKMEKDVEEVITTIGAYIIKLYGMGDNILENKEKILENIRNKKALEKLIELVEIQGGDAEYIKNPNKFEKAKYKYPVMSEEDGYIEKLNAEEIGVASVYLGAGRIKKEDKIDYSVGIEIVKKIGDKVDKGEILSYIYSNDEENIEDTKNRIINAYKISNTEVEKQKHIIDVIV